MSKSKKKGKKKVSFVAVNRARKHAGSSRRNNRGPRVNATALKIGKVIKTSAVKFKPSRRAGTIYQPIIDKIEKLDRNESFIVPTPKGITAQVFHNRMNMALARKRPQMKPGLTYRKGTDINGDVIISSVDAKKPKKAASKSRKPKSKKTKRVAVVHTSHTAGDKESMS